MALRIRHKLIMAFSLLALFVTLVAFFAMLYTFRAGFLQYLNDLRFASLQQLSQTVSEQVKTEQDWFLVTQNQRVWSDLIRDGRRDEDNRFFEKRIHQQFNDSDWSPGFHRRPPPKPKFILLDKNKNVIHGNVSSLKGLWMKEVVVNNRLQGYVALRELKNISGKADKVFVAKQTRFFIVIALIACLLAIAIAVLIANWMAAPIQKLEAATNKLMQRDYDVAVSYKGNDEIGSLVQAFNQLAKSLASHQTLQQQWIADISHELRTPLSTLKAELEAMQDGVRDISMERIHSLHDDVLRLQRLVDDLHELSLSDAGTLHYRFSSVPLVDTINTVIAHHDMELQQNKLAVTLNTLSDDPSPGVYADPDRLHQLFENLMQNSLRYTKADGKVSITVKTSPLPSDSEQWLIEWEDSAPGVPEQSLNKLFDRLYRAEQSRNREQGGSGLGLAICKAIVESHGGEILAAASPLGGVKITISLPKAKG